MKNPSPHSNIPQIFCRHALMQHRKRAKRLFNPEDPLVTEIETRLIQRLDDFNIDYKTLLALGFRTKAIEKIQCDYKILASPLAPASNLSDPDLILDEELFPFKSQSLNVILAALSLHNINDLPGALTQFYQSLLPNGLFCGAVLSPESLHMVHHAFTEVEIEYAGGISPHVSPILDMKDLGALLRRAGFKDAITDTLEIPVAYASPLDLLMHLKSMGETNVLVSRKKGLTLPKLFQAFLEKLGSEPITIPWNVIFLTGWKKD